MTDPTVIAASNAAFEEAQRSGERAPLSLRERRHETV